MGAIVGIIVGLIVSLLTGGNDLKQLNHELIIPQLRKYLPQSSMAGLKDGYKLAPQNEKFIPEKNSN